MNTLERVKQWIDTELPCVFGAREYKNGRYFITELKSPDDIQSEFEKFKLELINRRTVAGLFVITDPNLLPASNVREQVTQCATYIAGITNVPIENLIDGFMLAFTFELECPVTGLKTIYNDFDAVAFTPLSANPSDDLFDPSVSAPAPLFNINSDIYAFSMFARDISLLAFKNEPYLLNVEDRERLFSTVESLWQRYSVATIKGFEKISDRDRCPFFLSNDNRHYIAAHQDPAFAEIKKVINYHDMPVIYAPKITEKWREAFSTGRLDLTSRSLTPYGAEYSEQEIRCDR